MFSHYLRAIRFSFYYNFRYDNQLTSVSQVQVFMCRILDNSVHVNDISRRYSFTSSHVHVIFCQCSATVLTTRNRKITCKFRNRALICNFARTNLAGFLSLRGTISFPVLLLKRVHLEVRELKSDYSDTHLVRTPDLLLDSLHCSLFSGVQIKRKTDSNIPLHCCSYVIPRFSHFLLVIHTSVFRLTARYDTRKEPVQSCLPLGKGIL